MGKQKKEIERFLQAPLLAWEKKGVIEVIVETRRAYMTVKDEMRSRFAHSKRLIDAYFNPLNVKLMRSLRIRKTDCNDASIDAQYLHSFLSCMVHIQDRYASQPCWVCASHGFQVLLSSL